MRGGGAETATLPWRSVPRAATTALTTPNAFGGIRARRRAGWPRGFRVHKVSIVDDQDGNGELGDVDAARASRSAARSLRNALLRQLSARSPAGQRCTLRVGAEGARAFGSAVGESVGTAGMAVGNGVLEVRECLSLKSNARPGWNRASRSHAGSEGR